MNLDEEGGRGSVNTSGDSLRDFWREGVESACPRMKLEVENSSKRNQLFVEALEDSRG